MRFRIETPPGFDFDRTVRGHGWYDLPPFEYDRAAATLGFAFHLGGRTVEVEVEAGGGGLRATVRGGSERAARRVLRSVLRLDDDLSGARAILGRDPILRRALDRGGGRLLRAPTMFEDVVKMLCTTNCSWALTRIMVGRLVEHAGRPGPTGRRAFPTAAALRLPERFFRDQIRAGYRAASLRELADRVAGGELDLDGLRDPGLSAETARARLRSIRGIGDYAADGLLRLLGHFDRLGLDSWCRAAFRRLHPRAPAAALDAAIARRYARHAPYQGLAMWLELTQPWFAEDGPRG